MKLTPAKAAVLSLTVLAAGILTAAHDQPALRTHAAPVTVAAAPYLHDDVPPKRASRSRVPASKPKPAPVHHVVVRHYVTPSPVVHHHAAAPAPAHMQRSAPSGSVTFSYTEMRVRSCESGPNGYATHGRALDYNYSETNPSSTASGGWQFLDGTWANFMGYARALYAPRWVQDLKARRYIDANGLRPWAASRSCWAG